MQVHVAIQTARLSGWNILLLSVMRPNFQLVGNTYGNSYTYICRVEWIFIFKNISVTGTGWRVWIYLPDVWHKQERFQQFFHHKQYFYISSFGVQYFNTLDHFASSHFFWIVNRTRDLLNSVEGITCRDPRSFCCRHFGSKRVASAAIPLESAGSNYFWEIFFGKMNRIKIIG